MDLVPPVVIADIKTIDNFEITNVEVQLNSKALVFVNLNNGNNILLTEYIVIDGTDYSNWGSDDEYIIFFVKTYIKNKYSV